jgi:hypothetical protein
VNITDLGGLFADLTGKSEAEILDALKNPDNPEGFRAKEEVENVLRDAFSAKFKDISSQQLGRAKRETMTAFEKQLREKFELDSNAQGVELVEELLNSKVKAAVDQAGKKEISEGEIKNHPLFQQAIEALRNEKQSLAQEFEQFKTSISEREHQNKVYKALRKELTALNPILPKGKEEMAVDLFLKTFNPKEFKVSENGNVIPVDQDGQPKTDANYNPLKLGDIVRQNLIFDVHKQDPNNSSPSPTRNDDGAVTIDNITVSSDEEYAKIMFDRSGKYSSEFKKQLAADYTNKKKQN